MALILSHALSCCLSRKSSKSKLSDEESHLIPPDTEITPSYSPSLFGPQTFGQRMLDIVRSKGSKMVSVTARSPFQLHNPSDSCEGKFSVAPLVEPCLSPTYSRSASAYSLPQDRLSARPFLPPSPIYDSRFRLNHTLSRSSSIIFPHDGRSTAEIYPGTQEDERSASRVRSSRSVPIFNIRFVRGPVPHRLAGIGRSRGRPRTKPDPEIDKSAPPEDLLVGAGSQIQAHNICSTLVDNDSATTPSKGEQTGPALSISPASTTNFHLNDSRPLIVDWDD